LPVGHRRYRTPRIGTLRSTWVCWRQDPASLDAVATSNAGALGSLPCALLALDAVRDELMAMW